MAITNGYCTLQEFKDSMATTSTNATDDAVIEDLIEGVSRDIDIYTGRTFYARTETHYYDTPSGNLHIEDDDLLTVTTLTNGDASVISSNDYKLLPLNRSPKFEIALLPSSGVSWQATDDGDTIGAISLLGTWGFTATAPHDIREICRSESVARYNRRFGQNANNSTTITAAGVVITPKGFSDETMRTLYRYVRLV